MWIGILIRSVVLYLFIVTTQQDAFTHNKDKYVRILVAYNFFFHCLFC
jgi:hypothetical protein